MKKVCKIILKLLISLISLILIVFALINIIKYPYYSDFRKTLKKEVKIPGLSKNFTPQGLCYLDDYNYYLISGYDGKTNETIIYIKGSDYEKKVLIKEDGKALIGHFGGITRYKNFVYVCDDTKTDTYDISNTLFIFNLNDILNQNEVSYISKMDVLPDGAYLSVDDNYLYVGEYYRDKTYVTDETHYYKENHSITSAYSLSDTFTYGISDEASFYISTPDFAQGFIRKDSSVVISSSYGLSSSKISFYHLEKEETLYLNKPLYYLGNAYKVYKAPPMSEGICLINDRISILYESATNKYMYGKFYFQNYIESIDFYNDENWGFKEWI